MKNPEHKEKLANIVRELDKIRAELTLESHTDNEVDRVNAIYAYVQLCCVRRLLEDIK